MRQVLPSSIIHTQRQHLIGYAIVHTNAPAASNSRKSPHNKNSYNLVLGKNNSLPINDD